MITEKTTIKISNTGLNELAELFKRRLDNLRFRGGSKNGEFVWGSYGRQPGEAYLQMLGGRDLISNNGNIETQVVHPHTRAYFYLNQAAGKGFASELRDYPEPLATRLGTNGANIRIYDVGILSELISKMDARSSLRDSLREIRIFEEMKRMQDSILNHEFEVLGMYDSPDYSYPQIDRTLVTIEAVNAWLEELKSVRG
jgi:hypothetical protein